MTRDLRTLPALALTLALAGCASVRGPADRAFEAGNYAGAAAAYEDILHRDPRTRDDARLLLRLGLAYAMPGSPVHEPAKALAVLKDVAKRFPTTGAGAQATVLVPQIEKQMRLTEAVAAARARIADLEGELTKVREEAHVLEAAVRARDEQANRLRASLADAQAQLKRVRDELEQLKRIDLRRAP
jgi:chromosome condensin MukBEF ATPase and DNA-binding subunit MukB